MMCELHTILIATSRLLHLMIKWIKQITINNFDGKKTCRISFFCLCHQFGWRVLNCVFFFFNLCVCFFPTTIIHNYKFFILKCDEFQTKIRLLTLFSRNWYYFNPKHHFTFNSNIPKSLKPLQKTNKFLFRMRFA